MKIGIDISQIVYEGSGIARFTRGLVQAICKYDDANEWHFFFSHLRQKLPADLEKLITERKHFLHKIPIPPTALSLMWNTIHVVDVSHFAGKLDWFITSDWTEPPSSCKKATVIHDFAYKRYPETVAESIKKTQEKRLHWVVKESDVIFADSQSTKDDAITYLHIPDNKIIVNYPGIDITQPASSRKESNFILTVGKLEPRKNIQQLIDAFLSLNLPDVELHIAGAKGWGNVPHKSNDSIKFLGFVPDEKLIELYERCLCFIYPSVWEGFGYPVIEAMAYGAPVATSNTSSLGEIAKGNALLFNPHNTADIAAAINKLVNDGKLRKELSANGKRHAKEFTWERYYDTMIHTLYGNRH